MFTTHNDNVDERWGVPRPDLWNGRSWDAEMAKDMRTNIHGPSPVGSQLMPSQVPVVEGPAKVNSNVG